MKHGKSDNQAAAGGEPAVIDRRLLHHGKKFDFEILTVRRPGGGTMERENVRHPGAIVVVPLMDAGSGPSLVLIRNFRVSVAQRLWECCAGTLEPGEDPAACAKRELKEETGYDASTITPLGWFYTTPGLTDEKMWAFVATGLSRGRQALEDDENIEVRVVPLDEALAMIDRGDIRDGKSIAAILIAQRRGELKVTGGGRNGLRRSKSAKPRTTRAKPRSGRTR